MKTILCLQVLVKFICRASSLPAYLDTLNRLVSLPRHIRKFFTFAVTGICRVCPTPLAIEERTERDMTANVEKELIGKGRLQKTLLSTRNNSAACEWMSPGPEDEAAGEARHRQSIDEKSGSGPFGPTESAKGQDSSPKGRQTNVRKRSLHTRRGRTYMDGCDCEEGIRS
jgi:hypothetical protein